MSPDTALATSPAIVVSSDSVILDRCARWANVGRAIVDRQIPGATIVTLAGFD